MSLIILFGILLCSVAALALKKFRLVSLLLYVNIFIFITIGSGYWADFLLNGLQIHSFLTQPQFKQKNLIVLLAGGIVKWPGNQHLSTQSLSASRVQEAARLYFLCKKSSAQCTLLISGGDPGENKTPEADVLQTDLVNIGVADSDILTETISLNTFQNAKLSAPLIHSANFDYILLVTSGSHMGRALMMFSNFGVEAVPAPSDYLRTSSSLKYYYSNFYLTDLALHEYVGQLKFLISK